jgi:hypothetical protein
MPDHQRELLQQLPKMTHGHGREASEAGSDGRILGAARLHLRFFVSFFNIKDNFSLKEL